MHNPWLAVLEELVKSGSINSEDMATIRMIADALSGPIGDLKSALERQPFLQVSAAYYRGYFKRLADLDESEIEGRWSALYTSLKENGISRPSEHDIRSALRKDPTYLALMSNASRHRYFADQLVALHDALVTRARLLEQLSNNERASFKAEEEDV